MFNPKIEVEADALGAEAALAGEISDEWRVASLGYSPAGTSGTMSMGGSGTTEITLEALLIKGASDGLLPGGNPVIGRTSMNMSWKTTGVFSPSADVESNAPAVFAQMVEQTSSGAALVSVIPAMSSGTMGGGASNSSGETDVPLDVWYVVREGEASGWEHCTTQTGVELMVSSMGKMSIQNDTSEAHFTEMSGQGWRLITMFMGPMSSIQPGSASPVTFTAFWARPAEAHPALECFVGEVLVSHKANMSGGMKTTVGDYQSAVVDLAAQGWILQSLISWPGMKQKGLTSTVTFKAFFQRNNTPAAK